MDIGGTKVAIGVGADDGTLIAKRVVPTPTPANGEVVLRTVTRLIGRALSAHRGPRDNVVGIGIGTAGVVDTVRGVIVSSSDTLVGWAGMPVKSRLQETFGLDVVVDNDVNALAFAEARLGAGRQFPRLIVATIGTGIGGAFVSNGVLEHGATGTAGEIGHVPVGPANGPRCSCGHFGHLESYASGPAMSRRYGEISGTSVAHDFRAVMAAAHRSDAAARSVVIEGATALGRGLAGIVNVFDPDALILGGGLRASGRLFMTPFQRAFRSELLPGTANVRLLAPRFPTYGGVIGAIAISLDQQRRFRSDLEQGHARGTHS